MILETFKSADLFSKNTSQVFTSESLNHSFDLFKIVDSFGNEKKRSLYESMNRSFKHFLI